MKLCLAILMILVGSFAHAIESPNGAWMIRDLAIDIFDCQPAVCGKILWLHDPLRRPTQCNKLIIWGLVPDGERHWSNGTILDTKDGVSYNLSATLRPDGTLDARVFRGIPLIGRTEILHRVDPQTLNGICQG